MKENEEIRCGFKVSSNRKKIWNIELGILEEIKKICKKHNIKYYADGGTMLGAVRHKGFIPWDDDIDITMFRDDYEKFLKIAEKELPSHIKIRKHHAGFSQVMNINTSALYLNNWRDKDFMGGIWIDIFPIDYASKYTIINKIKSIILLLLRAIMLSQKSDGTIEKMDGWKKIFIYPLKLLFSKTDCSKIYKIHDKVSKKVFFKGKDIYTAGCVYRFFPDNIYNKCHIGNFEDTTINIPDGYDTFLKILYGDYMKPVVSKGGHNCRYSVDKSYKEIIKSFDKSKSNEENYNNCKDLFLL